MPGRPPKTERYKWIVLSNTTLGVLMATIDISIMLIALPDIFRGIDIDPLAPGNSFYLLWMILSFMVVTSVLVVSLGRLGDMYGRVKMYNRGFVVYTFFSLLLTITWMSGTAAALWLVIMRVFQGVGAAMLLANSAAILTDAFPEHQRGMAIGINQVAGISGAFIGLVLGGLLAPIQWRLIFLVSVPVGLFGTVWAYRSLKEVPRRGMARLDWPGNVTFALGLIAIMVGITYGIQPYGHFTMGWTSPLVIASLGVGVALLTAFAMIETRVQDPMFRLQLFKIRAFTAGSLSSLLSSVGRGGLMFMLIIWLQGIWLPRHGYSFSQTPLWAGIYMLPLTAGFLLAGPASGLLSDRYGARPFATGGMIAAAGSFLLLELLPINFSYAAFGPILLLNGLSMGTFAAPNRAGVMNSLPPQHRGVGSGMNSTFQNSAQVLSIGIFFTLMIVGLSGQPARHALPRPARPRGAGQNSQRRGAPAPGVHPVLRVPRLQPGPAPGRPGRPGPPASQSGGDPNRPELLPEPHQRPVRQRPAHRVRLRHRRLPGRRGHVLAARRQVPLPRGGRTGPGPSHQGRVGQRRRPRAEDRAYHHLSHGMVRKRRPRPAEQGHERVRRQHQRPERQRQDGHRTGRHRAVDRDLPHER